MTEFAHGPATVRLGDLVVKRLGFGAMQIPGPMVFGEPKDPEAARRVLRRVVELGIDLVDTAWYYGPHVSNRFVAEVLHPYPKGLVIATKLGGRRTPDAAWHAALRPEELEAGCDDDLRVLRLERIDVCHLRWHDGTDVPFGESLDAMIAMVERGKIRHLGLSNVTMAQLRTALERTPIVTVQNLYNAAAGERRLARNPFSVTDGQEAMVDFCAERGIAFIPFFTLAVARHALPNPALAAVARAHGATEAQVAIAWQLARSPTLLPIPGTSSVAHLEENWNARTLRLSPEELARISEAR